MRGLRVRWLPRHAKWVVLAATMAVCALSAAPASAIMVKLPRGGYANYAAMGGASAPKAAKIFDAIFTNLDYSGGPVMPSNVNYEIIWQPSNYSGVRPQYQSASGYAYSYVNGVQKFMQDMAGDSGHATNSDSVSTQYNDSTGARAMYNFGYGGQLTDTDALPANGCPSGPTGICITDAQIQAELDYFLSSHGLPADLSHEYYLLTPPDVVSCFDAAGTTCSGQANSGFAPPPPVAAFCAYHSRTPAGYVYSNIPDLSGLQGCDPFIYNPPFPSCPGGDTCNYDNGPADGVLSAISHEHNESITDPEPNNAWTDWGSGVGGEIGDKCNNDAFASPNLSLQSNGAGTDTPYNQTIGGDHYLIQREWSNQTKSCLDSFTANTTTATATFTDSTDPTSVTTENFAANATSSPGGVAEYVWQFNDGPSTQGGQASTIETPSPTISHSFPSTGVFTVALTVMNADGTSYGTAHPVYVGGTAPTAGAISAGSSLEGTPVTLSSFGASAPTPGATIVSYAWSFGDGTSASGASVSHVFAAAGTYTATLVVTDSYGQVSAPVTRSVVISDEPPLVAFIAPSGFAGRGVTFAAFAVDPDGSIVVAAWNFGDGHTGSGTSTSHVYGAPGTYTVTAIVTDSAGHSAAVAHAVTIAPALCVVPGVRGDTLSKARAALNRAHCSVGKVRSPKKPKKGPGKHHKWVLVVAGITPGRGTVKPHGAKIALKMTWKSVHT